jgi:hypothetical protein
MIGNICPPDRLSLELAGYHRLLLQEPRPEVSPLLVWDYSPVIHNLSAHHGQHGFRLW